MAKPTPKPESKFQPAPAQPKITTAMAKAQAKAINAMIKGKK